TRYGEKICLRIVNNFYIPLKLEQLITHTETLEILKDLTNKPSGLILIAGPCGAGKTTTLYSILAELNDPRLNISTIEDPIEYTLPNINQCQVMRKKGLNFSSFLNEFRQQGVDVILVGETRDLATAKATIEMALTGRLVMTAIHASDTASAIIRLDEIGIESWQVSNSLIGVCAQRLIRRVCDNCKIAYQPTIERLNQLGLSSNQEGLFTFYKANELQNKQIYEAKQKGHLCPDCQGLGYQGRVGLYEVMKITETLKNLIKKNAPIDIIKKTAIEEGMITLFAYGLNLVKEGVTTLEELEKASFNYFSLEK
ncbi:MAG TPA: ATPase, T2SS/T4P/T4SS family, partial [Allocoleopsis sp.]